MYQSHKFQVMTAFSSSDDPDIQEIQNVGATLHKRPDVMVYDVSSDEECTEIPKMGQWEKHTRGIGSKLLHKMGYIPGEPLGKKKGGLIEPIEAVVLPKGMSLDFIMKAKENGQEFGVTPDSQAKLQHKQKVSGSIRTSHKECLVKNTSATPSHKQVKKPALICESDVRKVTAHQLTQRSFFLKDSIKKIQTKRNQIHFDQQFKIQAGSELQVEDDEAELLEENKLSLELKRMKTELERRKLMTTMSKF
jgi:predicted RNA-binding protein YlxR (DUF448 family)